MKKTILSLVAATAMAQAGGSIETMAPLTNLIPEAQGSLTHVINTILYIYVV